MRRRIVPLALPAGIVLAAALLVPGAAQVGQRNALAPPSVVRVPAFATRAEPRIDLNAPLSSSEFASAIKTPADRTALADAIARRRYAESQRWAGEPSVTVKLRGARY
jgi:hypothetical protein